MAFGDAEFHESEFGETGFDELSFGELAFRKSAFGETVFREMIFGESAHTKLGPLDEMLSLTVVVLYFLFYLSYYTPLSLVKQ